MKHSPLCHQMSFWWRGQKPPPQLSVPSPLSEPWAVHRMWRRNLTCQHAGVPHIGYQYQHLKHTHLLVAEYRVMRKYIAKNIGVITRLSLLSIYGKHSLVMQHTDAVIIMEITDGFIFHYLVRTYLWYEHQACMIQMCKPFHQLGQPETLAYSTKYETYEMF